MEIATRITTRIATRPPHERDLPMLAEIERRCFDERAWTDEDCLNAATYPDWVMRVAELWASGGSPAIAGFICYHPRPTHIELIGIAVAPHLQRRGVGRQLIDDVLAMVSPAGRVRLDLIVRETNVAAQAFFRACGLRCVAVKHSLYGVATSEDAYHFQYRHPAAPPESPSETDMARLTWEEEAA